MCLGTPEGILSCVFVADGEKDAAGRGMISMGQPACSQYCPGVVREKVMQNKLPGQHQPFSASFCPLLQHSVPLQALSSRGLHCEAQLFIFFSMVHEQQLPQPQKWLAPGPGSPADSISEGLFLWTHFSWAAWSGSPSGPATGMLA